MNTKILFIYCLALMLLTACGGTKKPQQERISSSELISAADNYGYDTVAVTPGDTVCNTEVDNVLRHYPEFYHATKNAKKSYEAWTQQEKTIGLKTKPEVMDISMILDRTLHGKQTVTSDSVWQALPIIDSLYLQMIANMPEQTKDVDARKTDIGRTRKAWQSYTNQLQRLANTVPEGCRERYLCIVAEQTRKYQLLLQQANNK